MLFRSVVDALLADGDVVRAVDARAELPAAEGLRARGVDVRLGVHEPSQLDGVTSVVTSPGVPERAPILAWAQERRLPVMSELEFGARRTAVPTIAITGTNGKSTTTELVASMLRAGGRDAVACGNIGYPLTTAAAGGHDALAVEASSFQLRFRSEEHTSELQSH